MAGLEDAVNRRLRARNLGFGAQAVDGLERLTGEGVLVDRGGRRVGGGEFDGMEEAELCRCIGHPKCILPTAASCRPLQMQCLITALQRCLLLPNGSALANLSRDPFRLIRQA